MGEWAPLGPAADLVERPLVLMEGARVPRPLAKSTTSRHIQAGMGWGWGRLKPLYQQLTWLNVNFT